METQKFVNRSDLPCGSTIGPLASAATGISALGAAYAVAVVGTAAVGALAEKPELLNSIFLILVLPETIVILGFVVALGAFAMWLLARGVGIKS